MQALIHAAQSESAACGRLATLEEVRIRYLGKKGIITEQLKALGSLPPDARREAGQRINHAKQQVVAMLEARAGLPP